MHTGVWVKRVKSKVPLLRTNLVPRISLLPFLFAMKEGKKRDPGKEVGFVPLVSSMYPHSHSAAHDQGPWCENKDSRRYKVQTFVISSNSCNTASSSSWVKLPLKSSSISCGKKIKTFCLHLAKNCRNQSFSIDITHPLILNSFPGFIHYSFYIFNGHYLRQKEKKIDMTFYLQILTCFNISYWI